MKKHAWLNALNCCRFVIFGNSLIFGVSCNDSMVTYETACLCHENAHEMPKTASLPQACFWTQRAQGYDGIGEWMIDAQTQLPMERIDTVKRVKRSAKALPSDPSSDKANSDARQKRATKRLPFTHEAMVKTDAVPNSPSQASPCVDINKADIDELMTLPGIGKSRAEAILKARQKRPFRKPESITRVKGIGKKGFQKMKKQICDF